MAILDHYKNAKPKTKRVIIVCITIIIVTLIVAAAYTGNFDKIYKLLCFLT